MTVEYLDRASHKRTTTGTVEYDTKSCIVIRPAGAKFTVAISKNRILHIEL